MNETRDKEGARRARRLSPRVLVMGAVVLAMGMGCAKKSAPPPIPDLHAWSEFRGDESRRGGPMGSIIQPPLYLLWSKRAGRSPAAEPCLIGRSLIVAATDRKVRRVDLETGRELWKTKLRGTPSTGLVASRGLVFVGHQAPRPALMALALDDGKEIWTREDLSPRGTPLLRGDTLFVAGVPGFLEAILASTGDTLWRLEKEAIWPGPLAHVAGTLVTCDDRDSVRARSSRDGSLLWSRYLPGGSRAGATISEGRLFVVGNEGALIALDLATGELAWETALKTRVYAPAVVQSGAVWVAGLDGKLREIDATTGEERWSVRLLGACRAAPAVAGDMLVVPTMGAVCQLVSRTEQRVVHTVDLDRAVRVGALVSGNRLFTVDEEGRIYAYESS